MEQVLLARYDAVSSAHTAQHNLSPAEAQVLRMLRQQTELVIKPADKNLGLTIMCACDYHAAVQAHVADTNTYRDVTDCVDKVVQSACNKLQNLVRTFSDMLGKKLSEFLLEGLQMTTPAHLYIMPKLHKMRSLTAPIVGRPIAACHSWVSTNTSKWVAGELNATLVNYDTVLKDRTQLLRELDGMRVSQDAWLLTFDVESLYPHVEHEGCIQACAHAVSGSNREQCTMAAFLQFVLENNVVSVQNKHYLQVFGGAMGTNCMPPAAQLYLAVMWEGVIKRHMGSAFPKVLQTFHR